MYDCVLHKMQCIPYKLFSHSLIFMPEMVQEAFIQDANFVIFYLLVTKCTLIVAKRIFGERVFMSRSLFCHHAPFPRLDNMMFLF